MEELPKQFNLLENKVKDWYIEKYPFLAEQLKEEYIKVHEYSGSGYFVDFSGIDEGVAIPDGANVDSPIEGPFIVSPELEAFTHAILFHDGAHIHQLELYSFEDLPRDLKDFQLQDERPTREQLSK